MAIKKIQLNGKTYICVSTINVKGRLLTYEAMEYLLHNIKPKEQNNEKESKVCNIKRS